MEQNNLKINEDQIRNINLTELDKIAKELEDRGLNKPREWAKILMEKIPISNMEGLKKLKPNYFDKINSLIENDFDRDILMEIFNFDENSKNLLLKDNQDIKITEFDKVVEKLNNLYLNDSNRWAKILMEKIPFSYAENLNHLRPSYFPKIEGYIKNDIDRDILKKLFNVEDSDKGTFKEERKRKQIERKQKIDDLMSQVKEYKSANKMNQDDIDGKLTALMAELDLNPQGFKPDPEYRKALIDRLDSSYESIQKSGQVVEKENIDIETLAAQASEATLLKGVYFVKDDLDTIIKERDILINCPSNIRKLGVQKPDIIDEVTTEKSEEHGFYKELIKKSGDSVGVSGGGSYFGVTVSASVEKSTSKTNKNKNTENTGSYFYSKFKYNCCPMQTLSFNPSTLELTENALHLLKAIEYHIDNGDEDKAKTDIKHFFEIYGSHAKTGPFLFGGTFIINSNAQTNTKEKSSEVLQAVADQVSTSVGVSGFGFSVGMSYSKSNEQADLSKSYSKEVASLCRTTIEVCGGPRTTDFVSWKYHISKTNADWAVISNGNGLEPIWKIITRNHKNSFKDSYKLSNFICTTWCEINKTILTEEIGGSYEYEIFENNKKIGIEYLENFNSLFKEDKNKFLSEITNDLIQLVKFKNQLIEKTENINSWTNFMSETVFQSFISNLMILNDALYVLEESKSIVTNLNDILKNLPLNWDKEFSTKVKSFIYLFNQNINSSGKSRIDIEFSLNNISDFINVSQQLQIKLAGLKNETNSDKYKDVITKFYNMFNNFLDRYELSDKEENSSHMLTITRSILIKLIAYYELNYDLNGGYFFYKIDDEKLSVFNNKLWLILKSYENDLSSMTDISKKEIKNFAFVLKLIMDYSKVSGTNKDEINEIYKFLQTNFKTFPFKFTTDDFLIYNNKQILKEIIETQESNLQKPSDDHFQNKIKINNDDISQIAKILDVKLQNTDDINVSNSCFNDFEESEQYKEALKLFNLKDKLRQSDIMVLSPFPAATQVYSIDERPVEIRKQLLMKNPKCLELLLVINNANKKADFDDDLFFEDDSETPITETNNDITHVNDILVSLFYVSDPLVREIYSKNLNMCGKAIPFILPKKEILLWQLQDIVKTWKCYKEPIKSSKIINYQSPIISFVRLGEMNKFSKSELINGLFFKETNVFINKKITSQQSPPKISQGLIEISWYCPEHTITSDLDQNNPILLDKDMVTILNLRGDANKFLEQLNILRMISDLVIVLVQDKNEMEIPKFSNDDPKLIVITNATKDIPTIKDKRLVTKIPDLNDDFYNKFRGSILKNLYTGKLKKLTLEKAANLVTNNQSLNYILDLENNLLSESFYKAKEFIDFIKDKKRNKIFSLGGSDLWGKYVSNEKKLNRLINEKSNLKNLEKLRTDLINENENIRITQQIEAADQTTPIWLFIRNLLSLNSEKRVYYMEWINILLNEKNNIELSPLIKERNIYLNKKLQSNDKNLYKVELDQIGNSIKEMGFGIEQIIREIGQVYESFTYVTSESQNNNQFNNLKKSLKILPSVFAELCMRGLSLEIMDGDNSYIPVTWISDVFSEISNFTKDKRVGACSILGTQSTGKSTFLNALFNFKFAVAAERCTKGMYMKIIKVDKNFDKNNLDYLVILDTEGLRAPELLSSGTTENHKRDNEMGTTVIGLSDLTMINMMKLYNPSIMDILNIVVHAVLKIRYNTSANITPKCMFVHQDINSLNDPKKVNAEAKNKMKESLDKMTSEASKFLGLGDKNFGDVIPNEIDSDQYIDPLFEGSSFNAPISYEYVRSTQAVKYEILKSINSNDKFNTFENLAIRLKDLWKAVLRENFAFAFVNTLELNAYNQISEKYNKYLQEFSSEISESFHEWKERLNSNNLEENVFNIELNKKKLDLITKYKNDFEQYIEDNSKNNEYFKKEKESILKSINNTINELFDSTENEIKSVFKQKGLRSEINDKIKEIEKEMFAEAKVFHSKYKGQLNKDEIEDKFNKEVWQKILNKFQTFLEAKPKNKKDPKIDALEILKMYENKDQGFVNEILSKGWPYSKTISSILNIDLKIISNCYTNKRYKDKFTSNFNKERETFAYNEYLKIKEELMGIVLKETTYDYNMILKIKYEVDKKIEKINNESSISFYPKINIYLFAYILDDKFILYDKLVKDEQKRNDPKVIIDTDLKPKIINKLIIQFFTMSSIDTNVSLLLNLFKTKVFEKCTSQFRNIKIKNCILANSSWSKTKNQLLKLMLNDILINKDWEKAKYLCGGNGLIDICNNYIKSCVKKAIDEDHYQMTNKILERDFKNIVDNIINLCDRILDYDNFKQFFEFLKTELCSTNIIESSRIYLQDIDYNMIDEENNIFEDENLKKELKRKLIFELTNYLNDVMGGKYKNYFPFKISDYNNINEEITKSVIGCTNCCPFCKSPCEKTILNHEGKCETKYHFYSGISGVYLLGSTLLLNDMNCNGRVGSNWYHVTGDLRYNYKDYQQYHPNWHISADNSLEEAPFFQWFIGYFDQRILQHHGRTGWNRDISFWKDTASEKRASDYLNCNY